MTREEHKALLEQMRTAATDADRMQILIKLENDYTEMLSTSEAATLRATTAEQERDKYAKLNNELWLSNSTQKAITENQTILDNGATSGDGVSEPPKKMSYDDLKFD